MKQIPVIPKPTISRLCKLYSLLEELNDKGLVKLSSNDIGRRLGVGPHNIRKDLTYLGETGTTGSGYEIKKLKDQISRSLGFDIKRKACIVGLGKMGTAILSNEMFFSRNFEIIAGFDTNINRLETLKIDIPLYPTYDIPVVIRREKIELALLTIAGETAQNIAEKLVEGGIKGIVNFSPAVLSSPDEKVYISNIDIIDEFRFLSALFTLEKKDERIIE